jgi:hypothetical protein
LGAAAAIAGVTLRVTGAVGALAVTVNVIDVRPVVVAMSVFVPGEAPSVQLPMVAMPDVFVVCVAPVAVPPPDATVKVTPAPKTGAPELDVTFTLGSADTG